MTFPFTRFRSDAGEGGGGAEPGGQEPPNPQHPSGQPTGQEPKGGEPDNEALKRELAETRREAAKHRTEKNALEAELKKRQDAELSETERLKQQVEESNANTTQLQQRLIQSEVKVAAQKLGIINPDLVVPIVQGKIEMKDGEPTNIEALLTDLVKANPYLVEAPKGSDGGAGNPARGNGADTTPLKNLTWNNALTPRQ